MARLKDRNKFIPNGFIYYVPATGWKAPQYASFDTIVNALIAHRRGNPFLAQKFGWATDYATVANEVDEFNAMVCLKMGWADFVADAAPGGGPAPVPFQPLKPTLLSQLDRVAAGGRVLIEWIKSGEESVPVELAEARAAVCVKCPLNSAGDWTSFFTVPVSNKIKEALEDRRNWNLKTSLDDKLHVCSACYCPLPLKIFMGLDRILSRMPQESFDALAPECWIRSEKLAKG